MEITSSYKVRIMSTHLTGLLKDNAQLYQDAVKYLIEFYFPRWDEIAAIKGKKKQFNYAEHLVHTTDNYTAVCDFDTRFYKMPCYLRRAVIKEALGCVSSYVSNHKNWENGGKQGGEPTLQTERNVMPTFYNSNMFQQTEDPDYVMLKLYVRRDWVWVPVKVRKTDVSYLKKHWSHIKPSAPTLEKRFGKYYLRFAFTEQVTLSDRNVLDQRICAVDLGINTDATCSIMTADGTVLARQFINFASEKDCLYRVLNRIKKLQRENGNRNGAVKNAWAYAKRLNDELAKLISSAITSFASLWSVDCIVFEYLDMKGKKHGSKKQKLALWKKNGIQKYTEQKAHRSGMHISHICAWGTSKLAFDGSGVIVRGRKSLTKKELREILDCRTAKKAIPDGRPETYTNKETCTFTTGKEYNCDLSASYNIGARYFIRGILSEVPDSQKDLIFELFPDAEKATTRTLSTLWALNGTVKQDNQVAAAA